MGSVKDLEIIQEPTELELGSGIFRFSNRYSVFDWGAMPDEIPGKGAALCLMSAFNFEMLEKRGIPTHYNGVKRLVGGFSQIVETNRLLKPSSQMAIKLESVTLPEFLDGEYDYSLFINNRGKLNNFVVPLEVIYRRGAPLGSSLFKKIKELEDEGETDKLKSLLAKYGLTQNPQPGDLFPETGYDFTTKFESEDRRLTDDGAYEISGLDESQFIELENLRDDVVKIISERASEVGFVDFDGKHEYIYANEVMLADVVGTFDENRFIFNGEQVSKEFLRQWYKNNNPEWIEACKIAKEQAKQYGIKKWQSLVEVQPMSLPPKLVDLVGEMYMAGSDGYTGLDLFNVRPLEHVMKDIRPYRN